MPICITLLLFKLSSMSWWLLLLAFNGLGISTGNTNFGISTYNTNNYHFFYYHLLIRLFCNIPTTQYLTLPFTSKVIVDIMPSCFQLPITESYDGKLDLFCKDRHFITFKSTQGPIKHFVFLLSKMYI